MKILGIDKIFVCHHKPLLDRKDRLDTIFKKINLEVEWIENFLPEDIDYVKEVGNPVIEKDCEYAIQQNKYIYYENVGKKVSMSELSLYLKHKYCYLEQIKNNYENILILEDDVNVNLDFIDYMNNNMLEFLDKKPDILVLGTAFGFIPVNFNGKYIHINDNQLTRCTHAQVINRKCVEKIVKHLYPINLPIDFKLNEIIILERLKIAWSEPGLTQFSFGNSTIKK
jgi:GR25 family glycosyltransferase involved in LPS biosynthesis